MDLQELSRKKTWLMYRVIRSTAGGKSNVVSLHDSLDEAIQYMDSCNGRDDFRRYYVDPTAVGVTMSEPSR